LFSKKEQEGGQEGNIQERKKKKQAKDFRRHCPLEVVMEKEQNTLKMER
jgi:hypothetical protein